MAASAIISSTTTTTLNARTDLLEHSGSILLRRRRIEGMEMDSMRLLVAFQTLHGLAAIAIYCAMTTTQQLQSFWQILLSLMESVRGCASRFAQI